MSPVDRTRLRTYDGFDPPTVFRYGVAFEPIENEHQRLTTSLEINQPADNAQVIKLGRRVDVARTGWRSAAATTSTPTSSSSRPAPACSPRSAAQQATVDYAFTDGGFLGAVNRLSLGVRF